MNSVYITTLMRREADNLQRMYQKGYAEAQRLLREGADHIDALDHAIDDIREGTTE